VQSLHWGDAGKYLAIHDFMCIASANPAIRLGKLALLGDLVIPDGGKDIVEKVRRVRAGEKLNF
jgi:hypothetical protein